MQPGMYMFLGRGNEAIMGMKQVLIWLVVKSFGNMLHYVLHHFANFSMQMFGTE